MSDPRYPLGKFHYDGPLSPQQQQAFLDAIVRTPANLRTAVRGLSEAQLDTPYRPEGWTVRQVVHHVPDSHLNAYLLAGRVAGGLSRLVLVRLSRPLRSGASTFASEHEPVAATPDPWIDEWLRADADPALPGIPDRRFVDSA